MSLTIMKTPSDRFLNLPDYDFSENYKTIKFHNKKINMHYVDINNDSKNVILLLHGEPTWSYLYRHMIKRLAKSGRRIIAPDLIGFGKSYKLVEKLGVSIYDPNELDHLMNVMEINIVQAPLNIIDSRLEASGWLSKLHKNGIEVHTRSSFLQGLLLMPRVKIPSKFNRWSKIWDSWSQELEKNNLDAASVCLSYPLSLPEVSRVIVGVDSFEQLQGLILASNTNVEKRDWSFMKSSITIINADNGYMAAA